MADTAPVTFNDLPDDMLHDIFGRVFAEGGSVDAAAPPRGTNQTLHSVCRRWRRVADWSRLPSAEVRVDVAMLADVDTVRPRHPAAMKKLSIEDPADLVRGDVVHTTRAPRAMASLIGGSPDLRRSLSDLRVSL